MDAHLTTSRNGRAATGLPAASRQWYILTMLWFGSTLLLLAALLSHAATAAQPVRTHGTVVDLPASPAAAASPVGSLPHRGMSMAAVIDNHGEPQHRRGPVGDPPITRWDYPGFSVFFEYKLVLHSVVPGNPPPLHHRDDLLGSR